MKKIVSVARYSTALLLRAVDSRVLITLIGPI